MARKSDKFAEAVKEALGGLNPSQASYKTGISQEYIRKMAMGLVPSNEIIHKLAANLGVPLEPLLKAAEETPAEEIQQVLHRARVVGKINEDKERRIMEYVQRIIEDIDKGK